MSRAHTGVVAAGAAETADAGARVLERGGNAVDAAVAACFAATAAEPMLTSLAGAGIMTLRRSDGRSVVVDFFADAPLAWDGSSQVAPSPGDLAGAPFAFALGPHTLAVPGFVPGLCEAHERFGELPLRAVLEPVIGLMQRGVAIGDWTRSTLTLMSPVLDYSESGRQRQRETSASGTLTWRAEASLLEALASDWRSTYRELGLRLARQLEQQHGWLAAADFERYTLRLQQPRALGYRGAQLLVPPSPGQAHRVLESTLSELELLAPGADPLPAISRGARAHGELVRAGGSGTTTHVSVIDGAGNVVSVTTTHGTGSGLMIEGTNVMTNNILGEQHVCRGRAAGDRLATMMCPTIVLHDGRLIALGTGGSARIPSLLAQVVHRLVCGQDLKSAVHAGRGCEEDGRLFVEAGTGSAPPGGVSLPAMHPFFGGVHAAEFDRSGGLTAVGDPRRGGGAATVAGG